MFYVPSFAHSTLILKLSGLNSVESEIDVKRLLFLDRLITEPKMATVVKNLLRSRAESYCDSNVSSKGVLPNILNMLTPSLLLKLERCQLWFLKNMFYVPSFAHSTLILKLSGLNSVESEIDVKRLLFLDRLITEPKMATVVKNLLRSRAESYCDSNVSSKGVLPNICEAKIRSVLLFQIVV